MNVALLVLSGGAAATVTLACRLALSQRLQAAAPELLPGLPPAIRVLARLCVSWTGFIERRLSPRVERPLRARLTRAGLDPTLAPARWVGVLAAAAAVGAATSSILAAAGVGAPALLPVGLVLPPLLLQAWLKQRANDRSRELLKELPTLLELLVLCLEAGASLGAALRIAAEKASPGPLGDVLANILQRMRAGQTRAVALRGTLGALDLEATTALMTALVQAESSGMSLGPVLRAQAEQVMTARFVRAERAAMQAPVKLLLPLLACIFPCTFIVIAVPIVSRLIGIATS